jgi:hypothetical protein
VVLVDSVDTQQKTVGQERRTKVKGCPIGRSNQKKMNISIEKKRSSEKVIEYCWAIKDLETTLTDPDLWIADTGATVQSTANIAYANNWEPNTSNTVVVMGNGKKEKVTKIGKIEGSAKDKDGINQGNIILSDVMFLPNGKYNLISVTKVMKNGWKLEGDSNHFKLKKDKKEFVFNIKINTSRGILFAVRINNKLEMIAATEDQGNTITAMKKVDINDAHMLFGHLSENIMRMTAKRLGWCLTGEKQKCIHCAIGKGRQTNAYKVSNHIMSNKIGERMFLDLAAVIPNKDSDAFVESSYKRYWRILVDEASQFKISDFFETKNAMIEPTCEKLFNLKEENKTVKYIRCDDGGENQGLKNRSHSIDWKLPIKFDFTVRDTPQRNYLAEVGLGTIVERGRAIMSAAKVPKELCQIFWQEAFQTSTYLDGLILTTVNGVTKTRFEHWKIAYHVSYNA